MLAFFLMHLNTDLRVLSKYPELQSFSAFNSIFNKTGLFGIYASCVRPMAYVILCLNFSWWTMLFLFFFIFLETLVWVLCTSLLVCAVLLEILLLPNFDVGNNTCLAFLFMMCMLSYIALEWHNAYCQYIFKFFCVSKAFLKKNNFFYFFLCFNFSSYDVFRLFWCVDVKNKF